MIQFNWDKVKKQANGSNRELIKIIDAITWPNRLPSKYSDNKHYNWTDFFGLSFILEPEILLAQKHRVPDRDIVEYILLASKRCLADYMLTGNTKLDILVAPFIPQQNQLITTNNNEVLFKYE